MTGPRCYHGADECPPTCMCPCDICHLLRTDAYTGDAIDGLFVGDLATDPRDDEWIGGYRPGIEDD